MRQHPLVLVAVLATLAVTATACSSPPPADAPAAAGAARPAVPPPGDPATLVPDPAMACTMCGEWNQPRAPFKVFGNTYFVGTQGLSSVLIDTGGAGLVLIDVALPQSAPLIDANVRTLGLRTTDIKYILTSHAHYDHLGGVRSMQRFTRATVLASASTAQALQLGHPVPEDPQFGDGPDDRFPAVTDARVMKDGEAIQLGGTTITAHYTPGHTPGATTWTWRSCEGARCLNMVYVDSLTAVSKDGYRYTDHAGLIDGFRATMAKVAALPCDVLISTHPSATGMDEKLARRTAGGLAPGAAGDPFVDAGACKALAALSLKNLDARVQRERQAGR